MSERASEPFNSEPFNTAGEAGSSPNRPERSERSVQGATSERASEPFNSEPFNTAGEAGSSPNRPERRERSVQGATSERLSRRGLLTAGAGLAGLLVGGGAGAGIAVAAQPDTPALPRVTAAEELMYDHGILKRVLLCYRELSRRVTAGTPLPVSAVTASGELIRDYIESYHEGLEEAYVFPRLLQANRSPDVVRILLTQHDRGRHLTAAILDVAADGVSTAAARSTLAQHLDAFVRMYEPHEAWEDTVIFPAFREITPDRTWRLLAEQFATEQDRLFGSNTLQNMVDQVSTIESTLGLHDLATFTPPELTA